MPKVTEFHSVDEDVEPPALRVYHNNSACETGRNIPELHRRYGTHGYWLCDECIKANNTERRDFVWY